MGGLQTLGCDTFNNESRFNDEPGRGNPANLGRCLVGRGVHPCRGRRLEGADTPGRTTRPRVSIGGASWRDT